MDRSERLTTAEQDAGQTLVRRLAAVYPLKSAFWFRYADEDRWHLNVTLESMTRNEFNDVFARVRQIINEIENALLDPYDMTFLEPDNLLVQRAMELSDDILITSSHWQLPMNQGASVEAVLVYPKRDLMSNKPIVSEAN